jgi:hypothetical protein
LFIDCARKGTEDFLIDKDFGAFFSQKTQKLQKKAIGRDKKRPRGEKDNRAGAEIVR